MNRKDFETYAAHIREGLIPSGFRTIVDFMEKLKRYFDTVIMDYQVGTITNGFLDYTYFSFSDETLRSKGLKCLILVDHALMNVETWLIGKSKKVNDDFIEKLSGTPVRDEQDDCRKYAARIVLDDKPSFKTDLEYMGFIVGGALEAAASFKSYLD